MVVAVVAVVARVRVGQSSGAVVAVQCTDKVAPLPLVFPLFD